MKETAGDRLTTLMKRAGLKNQAVADAAGVHLKTVSYWRNDTQRPGDAELEAVVALFARHGVVTSPGHVRYGESGVSAVREPLPDSGRLWMAEFQVELLRDYGATDEEIRAALALVQSAEARAFAATGGTDVGPTVAFDLMADAVRAELARRHRLPVQTAPLLQPVAKRPAGKESGRHAQGGSTSRRPR